MCKSLGDTDLSNDNIKRKTKISVIIPVYNVEKYVGRCINSILSQTFKDFELIIVNDGSTDGSLEAVERAINNDERCLIFSKKNGGLSDARNYGLEKAKSDYIVFVDSNDYVERSYLEKLYFTVVQNQADVAICMYNLVDDHGKVIKSEAYNIPEGCSVVSGRDILVSSLKPKGIPSIVAWNKIYKKKLFDNVKYPKGQIHEDQLILLPLFWNVGKVALVDQKYHLYNYVQRDNSIMHGNLTEARILAEKNFCVQDVSFFKGKQDDELLNLTVDQYKFWIREVIKTRKWDLLSSKNKEELNSDFKKLYKLHKADQFRDLVYETVCYMFGLNIVAKVWKTIQK